MEEKYRKVKKENPAFQRRLGGLTGGDETMKAAGFGTQLDGEEEVYMYHAAADTWNRLTSAKSTIEAAVRDATAGAVSAGSIPSPAAAGGAAPFPPGGGLGAPGFGMNPPPGMQSAMAGLMADPTALQAMMQVRSKRAFLSRSCDLRSLSNAASFLAFLLFATLASNRIRWCKI